jgi:Kef-type K+ transport system membrane component KefB
MCPGWTAVFLWLTLATSVTGFFFPFHAFTPAIGVGIVSLLVLGVAFFGLYARKLTGSWRTAYVIAAVLAQYLNFFVLIVQSFLRIPVLHALAPRQTEPPVAIVQALALLLFLVLGFLATRKFSPRSESRGLTTAHRDQPTHVRAL